MVRYHTTPGMKLQPDFATLEHVIPRSQKGGSAMSNLALACCRCNSTRGVANNWQPYMDILMGAQVRNRTQYGIVRESIPNLARHSGIEALAEMWKTTPHHPLTTRAVSPMMNPQAQHEGFTDVPRTGKRRDVRGADPSRR